MNIADIKDDKYYEIPVGWDWLHMLPGWSYTKFLVNKRGFKHSITVGCNRERRSHDLAVKIDDVCRGLFHYYDFIGNGESLWSNPEKWSATFSFEFEQDIIAFEKLVDEWEKTA